MQLNRVKSKRNKRDFKVYPFWGFLVCVSLMFEGSVLHLSFCEAQLLNGVSPKERPKPLFFLPSSLPSLLPSALSFLPDVLREDRAQPLFFLFFFLSVFLLLLEERCENQKHRDPSATLTR